MKLAEVKLNTVLPVFGGLTLETGIELDANGGIFLKFYRDGKLYLPTGEATTDGDPVYRTLSLSYSQVQHTVQADISETAYYWDNTAKNYVAIS